MTLRGEGLVSSAVDRAISGGMSGLISSITVAPAMTLTRAGSYGNGPAPQSTFAGRRGCPSRAFILLAAAPPRRPTGQSSDIPGLGPHLWQHSLGRLLRWRPPERE